MPRAISGVFSLVTPGNPVVSLDFITSAWANTTLSDLAQGVTDSLDRQGRGAMLAPFLAVAGTTAAPGVAFSAEPGTGISRLGTGGIAVSAIGVEVLRATNTQITAQVPVALTGPINTAMSTIAAAATLPLAAAPNEVEITGNNVTITGIDVAPAGAVRTCRVNGTGIVLAHSGAFRLSGYANIALNQWDVFRARSHGGGTWIVYEVFRQARAPQFPELIAGLARRLRGSSDGNSMSASFDEIVLTDPAGNAMALGGFSGTANITVNGLNGLDTGSEVANTWYYLWVIATPARVAGLLISASATAPVMPSGYTYRALVSAARNDGASNLLESRQFGRELYYDTVAAPHQILNTGAAIVETALSATHLVPPIAHRFTVRTHAELQRTGAATADIEFLVRYAPGIEHARLALGHVAAGGSSFSAARDVTMIVLPNVSQQVSYALNVNTGGPWLSLWVAGFALPIGGE